MADPFLLLALALVGGATLALDPAHAAIGAAVSLALLRGRASRKVLVLCVLLLLVNALRARAALHEASTRHAATANLFQGPARCEGEAVVISSPVVLRRMDGETEATTTGRPARVEPRGGPGHSPSDRDERLDGRVDVEVTRATCEGHGSPLHDERESSLPRARLYGAPEDLGRGDRITFVADLAPTHLFLNEGQRDPRTLIARTGITMSGGSVEITPLTRGRSPGAAVDRARIHVRRRIEATFHPDAAPLARALVLGETNLRAEDDEAFRMSGLSHLLAVSGTHLVLAVLSFTAALRALLLRIEPLSARGDVGRIAAAVSIPAAWLYADFAGGGGSAVRAAAMLSTVMLARAVGRNPSAFRAFAASLFGAGVLDPLVLCDISFGLSAAATAGLLVLERPIAAAIVRGPSPVRKIAKATSATLAAMLACAPQLLLISPTLPLAGIAANVVAAPIGELAALPICLAHACLSWAPAAEQGAALVGSGALLSVRAVAHAAGTAGGAITIPPPSAAQLVILVITITAIFAVSGWKSRLVRLSTAAAAWLLLEVLAIRAGAPRDVLRVSILDVGQGDSALIDFPDGSAMLVDGGGFVGSPIDTGKRVVLPLLRARRRARVDTVVLSHPHPDHFGGLLATVAAIEVGELWDTGQGEDQGAGPAYASLLADARARGVKIKRPDALCGRQINRGNARIEVIAPCPTFHPDVGANDNSLVLRVSYGSRSALLVGDAESEEETELLRSHPATLDADLLKVGHHGSRTSTSPAFATGVSPSLAVISCGVRNRFGHPHPNTLATLRALAIPTLRTDRGGAVIWETDGDTIRVTRPTQ
jgi:competence protein ComEC